MGENTGVTDNISDSSVSYDSESVCLTLSTVKKNKAKITCCEQFSVELLPSEQIVPVKMDPNVSHMIFLLSPLY